MNGSTLQQLSEDIAASTKTLTAWLRENDQAEPAFLPNGPDRFPHTIAPHDILLARERLISASAQLNTLAQWPFTAAQSFANTRAFDAQALRCIIALNIPEHVPLEGSVTFAELAEKVDVEQSRLTRVLRYAMTNNFFLEAEPGRVAHSAMSALLVTSEAIRGQLSYQTHAGVPASASWLESLRASGQDGSHRASPFNLAFHTEQQSMQWALSDPQRAGMFNDMLKAYVQSGDLGLSHTVAMFDWKSVDDGTLVDVGGNTGTTVSAIAASAPRLNFIVQDLPAPVAQGKKTLHPSLTSRISFQEHDFFTPNPLATKDPKPDLFLLRNVLHDWSDDRATVILKLVSDAMGPQTKLLIVDTIVRAPGSLPSSAEKRQRVLDMTMFTMMNSKERMEEDWRRLIDGVGGSERKLVIREIVTPPGSAMSMMVVATAQRNGTERAAVSRSG